MTSWFTKPRPSFKCSTGTLINLKRNGWSVIWTLSTEQEPLEFKCLSVILELVSSGNFLFQLFPLLWLGKGHHVGMWGKFALTCRIKHPLVVLYLDGQIYYCHPLSVLFMFIYEWLGIGQSIRKLPQWRTFHWILVFKLAVQIHLSSVLKSARW